jgi:hypothetical protein
MGSIKIYSSTYLSQIQSNTCVFISIINCYFSCSDLVYDRDHHDHDPIIDHNRNRYIPN